ncbi:hypothetical protein EDEG_03394 [Edhazardia aedis USNM 41457]|uniref:Uncharacterized protein n=1 Tax=Edhazardia aedis (strain USNM 41457) TaxID=1003232 RepID=J9D2X5_EDHAE|nr:hypothetical protein EDEG_03394 [Edhazardia aedis USNM 41457]|eukprot:EJW02161.1 hypothetical protein EDEG_03394 [Edhazardia aedis USNM 41457]
MGANIIFFFAYFILMRIRSASIQKTCIEMKRKNLSKFRVSKRIKEKKTGRLCLCNLFHSNIDECYRKFILKYPERNEFTNYYLHYDLNKQNLVKNSENPTKNGFSYSIQEIENFSNINSLSNNIFPYKIATIYVSNKNYLLISKLIFLRGIEYDINDALLVYKCLCCGSYVDVLGSFKKPKNYLYYKFKYCLTNKKLKAHCHSSNIHTVFVDLNYMFGDEQNLSFYSEFYINIEKFKNAVGNQKINLSRAIYVSLSRY